MLWYVYILVDYLHKQWKTTINSPLQVIIWDTELMLVDLIFVIYWTIAEAVSYIQLAMQGLGWVF